jgi:hypothetical protein
MIMISPLTYLYLPDNLPVFDAGQILLPLSVFSDTYVSSKAVMTMKSQEPKWAAGTAVRA